MKLDIEKLIQRCNECILSCESTLQKCKECVTECEITKCTIDSMEACGLSHLDTINACYNCMHECNKALEHKQYATAKQEHALKKCIEVCKDTIKRCNVAQGKTVSEEDSSGCEWAKDSLNKCISACDECIESFEAHN